MWVSKSSLAGNLTLLLIAPFLLTRSSAVLSCMRILPLLLSLRQGTSLTRFLVRIAFSHQP